MIKTSIRIFRLWGIPVEINVSWLLILTLVTWTFATGYYPFHFPDVFSIQELWVLGFITAILMFLSILLHEFSHSLVASRNGLPIRKITLFIFGGVAQMDREVDNPVVELKTATAGPLMTVVLVAIFYSLSLLLKEYLFARALLRSLTYLNIVLLIFNMVPGFPLDGGRILRAAIWYRTGNLYRATRITSRIGRSFAFVLMILGVAHLFSFPFSQNLWTLIYGMWFIFIGFFLRQAAQSSYLMVALKETLGHLRVADVMRTGVIVVDRSTNLITLVDDYFLKHHYNSFPVIGEGKLVGIVSLKDVKQVERDQWPVMTVENIMDGEIVKAALHPSDSAEKLLHLIMKRGYGRLPVVDDDGNVVGVVTRRDLMEIFKMVTVLEE